MLLSVLIPTYNYDPSRLVGDLQKQLSADSEIIIGDDCSTEPLPSLPGISIFRPDHNLGRAGIRNALARKAKGEWLLFIDADAQVHRPSFVAAYLDAIASFTSDAEGVCCGGTANLPQCPRPAARLRYEYEVSVERRLTLPFRRRHPYAQFTTFNFLIRRRLFLTVLFDQHISAYGHEDTLFGIELQRRGIPIVHIDNPLVHLGLEDAPLYLSKTETALRTLARLSTEQQQHIRVSALALRLSRLHLLPLLRLLFRAAAPLLRANLLGAHPSLTLFAFYKLGYFARERRPTPTLP